MTPRDFARLVGVHPVLVAAITATLAALAAAGHPMFVICGVRTTAQQQELYSHGRNGDPRPIVTYKDGLRERSNHQVHANDSLGHAVDCAFQPSGALTAFDLRQPWHLYGEALERAGVTWGGRYPHLIDLPHAELV
jgi:peptidoglycan L-alanyl-D-glutamate endopeptidase CwlK